LVLARSKEPERGIRVYRVGGSPWSRRARAQTRIPGPDLTPERSLGAAGRNRAAARGDERVLEETVRRAVVVEPNNRAAVMTRISFTFCFLFFQKYSLGPKIFALVDFCASLLTICLIRKNCEIVIYFVMTCFIIVYILSIS
jgi:hypothetical protein